MLLLKSLLTYSDLYLGLVSKESLGNTGLSDASPAKPDWSGFCVPLRPESGPELVIKSFSIPCWPAI